MHYGPMYRYGNLFLTWLIPLVLIVLIGLALYMIFRKDRGDNQAPTSQNKSATSHSQSALKILNERYAMGEIDEEEFKRMKKNLMDD